MFFYVHQQPIVVVVVARWGYISIEGRDKLGFPVAHFFPPWIDSGSGGSGESGKLAVDEGQQ